MKKIVVFVQAATFVFMEALCLSSIIWSYDWPLSATLAHVLFAAIKIGIDFALLAAERIKKGILSDTFFKMITLEKIASLVLAAMMVCVIVHNLISGSWDSQNCANAAISLIIQIVIIIHDALARKIRAV